MFMVRLALTRFIDPGLSNHHLIFREQISRANLKILDLMNSLMLESSGLSNTKVSSDCRL